MLEALSAEGVRFLLVGALALAAHGLPRATGDIDIWVRPDRANAERVFAALNRFGAPRFDLTLEDLSRPGTVFQLGVPPGRIDILTAIDGVTFPQAWKGRLTTHVAGLRISVLGRRELERNKRAAARPKDLVDLLALQAARRLQKSMPRSGRARRKR